MNPAIPEKPFQRHSISGTYRYTRSPSNIFDTAQRYRGATPLSKPFHPWRSAACTPLDVSRNRNARNSATASLSEPVFDSRSMCPREPRTRGSPVGFLAPVTSPWIRKNKRVLEEERIDSRSIVAPRVPRPLRACNIKIVCRAKGWGRGAGEHRGGRENRGSKVSVSSNLRTKGKRERGGREGKGHSRKCVSGRLHVHSARQCGKRKRRKRGEGEGAGRSATSVYIRGTSASVPDSQHAPCVTRDRVAGRIGGRNCWYLPFWLVFERGLSVTLDNLSANRSGGTGHTRRRIMLFVHQSRGRKKRDRWRKKKAKLVVLCTKARTGTQYDTADGKRTRDSNGVHRSLSVCEPLCRLSRPGITTPPLTGRASTPPDWSAARGGGLRGVHAATRSGVAYAADR